MGEQHIPWPPRLLDPYDLCALGEFHREGSCLHRHGDAAFVHRSAYSQYLNRLSPSLSLLPGLRLLPSGACMVSAVELSMLVSLACLTDKVVACIFRAQQPLPFRHGDTGEMTASDDVYFRSAQMIVA